MALVDMVKRLYLLAETIYSCQTCGGMCQIKDDMKTDGQLVIARLKGEVGKRKLRSYVLIAKSNINSGKLCENQ